MAKKRKQNNNLTKKEQSTTTAYKMMSDKINNLEASLKKTQDESEKERQAGHELDKKLVLLESKLENSVSLEVFKFLSSGGIGFSINYITTGFWSIGLSIGIPSVVIFIVCIIVSKK
ncbi:MAG: hypothetical protein Q7R65_03015 [bacterium]|nr:hypothetical protein [bacterium]